MDVVQHREFLFTDFHRRWVRVALYRSLTEFEARREIYLRHT